MRRNLLAQWDKHVKECMKCLVTTAARERYCDEGWEIAKELTAVRSRIAELQDQIADEHPALF